MAKNVANIKCPGATVLLSSSQTKNSKIEMVGEGKKRKRGLVLIIHFLVEAKRQQTGLYHAAAPLLG
jgi:hypothetical protein